MNIIFPFVALTLTLPADMSKATISPYPFSPKASSAEDASTQGELAAEENSLISALSDTPSLAFTL